MPDIVIPPVPPLFNDPPYLIEAVKQMRQIALQQELEDNLWMRENENRIPKQVLRHITDLKCDIQHLESIINSRDFEAVVNHNEANCSRFNNEVRSLIELFEARIKWEFNKGFKDPVYYDIKNHLLQILREKIFMSLKTFDDMVSFAARQSEKRHDEIKKKDAEIAELKAALKKKRWFRK